ncbi:MAG: hypothetical protein ACLQQ4_11095 [Bacteroidia bacterium]
MEIKGEYANASLILKQGIEIDLSRNCYSIFNKLFNLFKFRESCKPLPKVDYILLFRTLYTKCQACSIKDFENSSVVQLSFVHDKNRKLIVHETYDIEYAKQLAKQLAGELKVKIKDSATDRRHPVWLR